MCKAEEPEVESVYGVEMISIRSPGYRMPTELTDGAEIRWPLSTEIGLRVPIPDWRLKPARDLKAY